LRSELLAELLRRLGDLRHDGPVALVPGRVGQPLAPDDDQPGGARPVGIQDEEETSDVVERADLLHADARAVEEDGVAALEHSRHVR
jgi:hypothetical protein